MTSDCSLKARIARPLRGGRAPQTVRSQPAQEVKLGDLEKFDDLDELGDLEKLDDLDALGDLMIWVILRKGVIWRNWMIWMYWVIWRN